MWEVLFWGLMPALPLAALVWVWRKGVAETRRDAEIAERIEKRYSAAERAFMDEVLKHRAMSENRKKAKGKK